MIFKCCLKLVDRPSETCSLDQDGSTRFYLAATWAELFFQAALDAVYLMDRSSLILILPLDLLTVYFVRIDDVDQVVFEGRGRRHAQA